MVSTVTYHSYLWLRLNVYLGNKYMISNIISNVLDFTSIVADEYEIFQTMSSLQMKKTFRHLESKWDGETG